MNNGYILDFVIPRGATGPTGPMGPTGTPTTIKGKYSSLQDLEIEHPNGNLGDAYLVNGDLYVWSPSNNIWQFIGSIIGPQGETGPQGEIGPTGPAGPQEIAAVYLITLNNNNVQGYTVESNGRIPLGRKEIDNTDICNLNPVANTITFNKGGVYRVEFMVSVAPPLNNSFDETTDIIAIGFKKTNENIVYAGATTWYNNDSSIKVIGQGIFVIDNENVETMELVNMSKQAITLKTPYLAYTTSSSYIINPVVTMVIQYLG